MNITVNKTCGNYDGKECFVLTRCGVIEGERLIMTAHKLDVSGIDCFSPAMFAESLDGGKTWDNFEPNEHFSDIEGTDGDRTIYGDFSHHFHRQSGTPLIVGRKFLYPEGRKLPFNEIQHCLCYSVYDYDEKKFASVRTIDVPGEYPYGVQTWAAQMVEEGNGDLLIPCVILKIGGHYSTVVVRMGFDGKELSFKEMSNEIDCESGRGFFEPSLVQFGNQYILTLRQEEAGYYSVSCDGKNFSEAQVWKWEDGEILPTYNTQQHWLKTEKALYLIYTRRTESNGHVFRNRAPLFISRVDTERMCLIRETEQAIVPERGARMGNFGVTELSTGCSVVTVAEWMQPEGCEKYGSDNTVYIVEISE